MPNWIAAHKKEAALGGGAAGVLALALYQRHKAAASGAPASSGALTGTTTSTPAGTISGAYPFSSAPLDQYNQLAGAISNANDAISAIQTQLSSAAVSGLPTGPTNGVPSPSPGPSASPSTGYTAITNPSQGSIFSAAGDTIYAGVGSQYVPVVQNGQRLPSWNYLPQGTTLYVRS